MAVSKQADSMPVASHDAPSEQPGRRTKDTNMSNTSAEAMAAVAAAVTTEVAVAVAVGQNHGQKRVIPCKANPITSIP
jgi:hypothetical protein